MTTTKSLQFPKSELHGLTSRIRFWLFFLLSIFYFLLSFHLIEATQLFFESPVKEIGVSQQFEVFLKLDPQNQSINAVEGQIRFSDNLKPISLNDGNSLITLWIRKPLTQGNEIIFSGIVPGGYSGDLGPDWQGPRPGKVLSLIFEPRSSGKAEIKIENGRILLNDGKGTPAELQSKNLELRISEKASPIPPPPSPKDEEPPEIFTPEITRDPGIFNGKWFLVFATQDKGTGIDYYEILERREFKILGFEFKLGRWEKRESPYLLDDQRLKSHIYIKAVDKTGNERVATLLPPNPLRWYDNYLIWVIMIFGVFLFIIWHLWRRKLTY